MISIRVQGVAVALLVCGGLLCDHHSFAQDQAVRLLPDTIWLDSETGTLKPVPVEKPGKDVVNRDSRWLPEAEKVNKPTKTNPNAAAGGAGGNGLLSQAIGWVLIAIVMLVVVGAVIYALKNSDADIMAAAPRRMPGDLIDEQTQRRMKELPLELQSSNGDPRSEAERLMSQGKYDRAIVMLYGYQLLILDRHGLLRLSRGKTNNRYVRETRNHDVEIAKLLRGTVDAFERSFFGKHPLDEQDFRQLWQSNGVLENCVTRHQGVAA